MVGPLSGSARALVPAPILAAPYGAAELRALAARHTSQGLAAASLLAVVVGGAASALRTAVPVAEPHGRLVVERWHTPPSVQPPAPAARSPRRVSPATLGTPTPVPDAQEPAEEAFSATPATGPNEGIEGVDGGASSGDGVGDVLPLSPIAEPPPAPVVVPPPIEPPPPPEVLEIAAVMPQVLEAPVPVYPALARQAGIEGRVIVRVRVSREGEARSVTIVRSDNAMLDEAAREAVARWRFRPGLQDGQPVDVWMTIPVRFRLRERS